MSLFSSPTLAGGFARRLQAELMDQPGLNPARHQHALRGLGRVNRVSRTGPVLWKHIRRVAAERECSSLRVLDLASGGGDVVLFLARRARQQGLELSITGCDVSSIAVAHASRGAAAASLPNVRFIEHDVLADSFDDTFDVVTCSLFLHHLTEPQAVALLGTMAAAARYEVLVDDLKRSRLGYLAAWLGCRLLTRSSIVHVDGPRSVENAFTPSEALRLAAKAGLTGATVSTHWPERFLLRWRRP